MSETQLLKDELRSVSRQNDDLRYANAIMKKKLIEQNNLLLEQFKRIKLLTMYLNWGGKN